MVLIGKDTYEDLTPENFEKVLDGFAKGKPVKPGPQVDRQFSAPIGGATTLTDPGIYASAPTRGQPGTTDAEAKRPGAAANVTEAPVPKPPLGDSSRTNKPKPN
jgi:NADH-quinone oxidoreductase subunit E